MIKRPCIGCGEPIPSGSRCSACRPKDSRPSRSHPLLHTHRWTTTARRLKRLSPACELCGATNVPLEVDHLVSPHSRPEWTFKVENLRVCCSTCNKRRGREESPEMVALVEARIAASKRRYASSGKCSNSDPPTSSATPILGRREGQLRRPIRLL